MSEVRLIDANALREEIETRLKLIGCFDGYEDSQSVLTYIDNAPTIYPICEDKVCKYRANERPKGEIDDTSLDQDAKQASIPYTYNAPEHDWKCGYPTNNGRTER